MIKIEIKDTSIELFSGIAKSGKSFSVRKQIGWAWLSASNGVLNPYPSRIEIMLRDDSPAYPVGVFMPSPSSFFVNRYGGLEIGLLLIPYRPSGTGVV